MEQIVFFTQFQKLREIHIRVEFPPIGYLTYRGSDSSNRILIIDEKSSIDNSGLLAGYTNYIAYHNLTLNNVAYKTIIDSTPSTNKLLDHHIEGDTKIYHEIKNIIKGFDDKKFEDLKNMIFNAKLEAALEFLHSCLVKKPDNLSQLKDFDIETPIILQKDGKEIEKNLKQLLEELNEKPLDDISSFESLRNGVLKMAVIN